MEGEMTSQVQNTKTPMFAGIIAFLCSEGFLFSALFFAFYYLRANNAVWPPQGVTIDLRLGIILTVILLLSSLTVWIAGRFAERGRMAGTSAWLGVTAALGAGFLGITVWEWLNEGFLPSSHAYGAIFFTLTGFHALHVFGGTVVLALLMVRSIRGRYSQGSHIGVTVGSYYWHFVDVIWLLVFTTIFIIK